MNDMSRVNPTLARAIAAHQEGRLQEAEVGYLRMLRNHPKNPDALHYYGLLQFQRGEGLRAVALIMQSLAIAPANPHAWNNLGNILTIQEKTAEAKEAYRRATVLDPRLADAWYNLGLCLRDEGLVEPAIENLRTAIAKRPSFTKAHETLGMLYYRLGRIPEAAKIYTDWSHIDPSSAIAHHMAAATSGSNVPARADDRYVAGIFDKFANVFDANLKNLGYRAPELVSTALAVHCGSSTTLDVLDAGCGTGLCGPLVRKLSRQLVGVDLSAGMLEKAHSRGGYDELVVCELCAFMRARPDSFDAIICADTLVYFGALEDAFAAAHHALRAAGIFVFTVEALTDESQQHRLEVHGRYVHSASYVRAAVAGAGFEVTALVSEALRRERGQDVAGYLVVARLE
jgi:predicted TPR repeat methyltransferase